MDEQDYTVFLNLLKRYLSKETTSDKYGRDGVTYYGSIELLAFCLMPNHFHLLLYINEKPFDIAELLRRLSTSYAVYFNKKYNRVGSLFQGTYKAVRINNDSYLQHISRYIHLNPKDYKVWEFSSLPYYSGVKQAEWVRPERILEVFDGNSYEEFLQDYEDQKAMLDEIKYDLADR